MLIQVKSKYVYLKEKQSLSNFSFKYTLHYNYTGNFKTTCKVLTGNEKYIFFVCFSLNISTKLYVFDRMIIPMLLYSSEVSNKDLVGGGGVKLYF